MQDLTKSQRQQLLSRPQQVGGIEVGQKIVVHGGTRHGAIQMTHRDSLVMLLPDAVQDTLRQAVVRERGVVEGPPFAFVTDSLLRAVVADSILRKAEYQLTGVDTTLIGAGASALAATARASKDSLSQRTRFSITRDTLNAGRVTLFSLVAPGFGQVYNRQPWKLPILYASVGGFLTGGILYHQQYKQYKADYQNAVNLRLPPEAQRQAKSKMLSAQSGQTIFYSLAGASYLYFVADAVFNYRGPADPVRKATTLAAVFPGAGFIYTKTYWRLPIYYGGFITLATVIDYNNRNYQRYKTAFDALTDQNPSTTDEFNGRYDPQLIGRVRDAYRRDRDLAIIGLAGAYLLSVIDTHVIASLKNWDMDEDLNVKVEPTAINSIAKNGYGYYSFIPPTTYGLAFKWRF